MNVPSGATAKVARQSLSDWTGPKLDAGELDTAAAAIQARLGLSNIDQLADVTQAKCLEHAQDAMEGVVLWAIVLAVQIHQTGCEGPKKCSLPKRNDPLPELSVEAIMGRYEDPVRPRDPLVLVFDKVERTTPDNPTKLFLVNRSLLAKSDPIALPGDLTKAVDGRYSLVLGDEWIQKAGLKAGNIIELYQTKGDRRSAGKVVAVNVAGPGVGRAPQLPPGDVIGNVTPRAMFRRDLDPVPTRIRPEGFLTQFADGNLEIRSKSSLAVEPMAKIEVDNLRTGQRGEGKVGADGHFKISVPAEKDDPILIRAVDHSHAPQDAHFERRLSLVAGRDDGPILAQNPALLMDGPPELSLGRVRLSDGCQDLTADRAVTPGTVVTLYRATHPAERTVTVADENGSFSVPLPFEPHADDVLVIEGKNPFALRKDPTEWQSKAAFRVELEIESDGSLEATQRAGRIVDGQGAVGQASEVDLVEHGEPVKSTRARIEGAQISFSTYDWRTGNSASLSARTDLECDNAVGVFNFDASKGEVVVTVSADKGGGWRRPELGEPRGARSYFEAVGRGSWTDQNSVTPELRKQLHARGQGGSIDVRFESPEGRVISRGKMNIEVKVLPHNTGASEKNHPVWFAVLDPSTLSACE
ncbi:MAG: hypothetical protein HY791_23670 [Deltaproteobacteria bacterium]|nr:hypothetical protein [Deltaproteobacteria bacterium]